MKVVTPHTKGLLHKAQHGDVDAFAELFEEFRPTIHSVAYRLVGADDCDDVTMETYLKAWKAVPRFRGSSGIKTWLCRIARNTALDFLRARSREEARREPSSRLDDEGDERQPLVERVADPGGRSPAEQLELQELGGVLREAIEALGQIHRTALIMREVDGLSYREIAAATGVSVGTVMSRLFHARRKVRAALEETELCVA